MRQFEQENSLSPAHIVALSGLSEEGAHSTALSSGQISQWLTKGGRSLKILGEGLTQLQAIASTRDQNAALVEAYAKRIREGLVPSAEFLRMLA